mgnify:CR=1 FL=1
MANDNTAFRTKSEPAKSEVTTPTKVVDKGGVQDTKVEVPYTDYENTNHHPYTVDHFKLGDAWKEKFGGFEKEVTLIENYFKQEIDRGQLKNEVGAVKEKMEKIYKLCGIDKTERTTMQIEKLSAYLEFLKKTDQISLNHEKYSH